MPNNDSDGTGNAASFHTFRLWPSARSKPHTSQSRKHTSTGSRAQNKVPLPTVPACHRCKYLKKKCSRDLPECELCVKAGAKCSYLDLINTSATAQLEARIAWLSSIINERLPHGAVPVDSLETGAEISGEDTSQDIVPEESNPVPISSPVAQNDESMIRSNDLVDTEAIRSNQDSRPRREMSHQATSDSSSIQDQSNAIMQDIEWQSPLSPQKLPQDAACKRFVDAYFRHSHRVYPFVQKDMVLKALRNIGDLARYRRDPNSRKLYLIMAIGCTTLHRAGQVSDETRARFSISYPEIVQDCLMEDNIESIEILLLLALYSLFDSSGLSPWTIIGLISRKSISAGLTRTGMASDNISPRDVEHRRRLFWSVFIFDRMISVSLGLPFALNDENGDVPLPGITIEEFESPQCTDYTYGLQIARHVIQLRKIESQILQTIHLAKTTATSSLGTADRRVIIQDLRSQIENWYSQGCLLSPSEIDNIPFHNTVTWLTVRYYNLLILLYSPSHFNARATPDQLFQLQHYIQKYIQSSAVLLQQRQLPLNWITFYRLLNICTILIYCFDRYTNNSQSRPFLEKELILRCATILDAFPSHWNIASRCARLFRQFSALVAAATSTQSLSNSNMRNSANTSSSRTNHFLSLADPGYDLEISRNAFDSIKNKALDLVREVMGSSSAYYLVIEQLINDDQEEADQLNSNNWGGYPRGSAIPVAGDSVGNSANDTIVIWDDNTAAATATAARNFARDGVWMDF